MIEQESGVERRIPEPGRFTIEQHQSLRADENVLRAEIAVHQGQSRPAQALRLLLEQAPQLRMTQAGREEIRFDPQRKEVRPGLKSRLDFSVPPRRAMKGRHEPRGTDCILFPGYATKQLRLPIREFLVEELHREQAGLRVTK